MDLPLTLLAIAALAAIAVGAGWRGALPADPRRGVRMAPWRFIMLLAAAGILVMIVHLVNVLGVQTGR